MKKQNISSVLEGLLIVVLGVLIAVVGVGQAVDIYFGVVSLVVGVLVASFVCYLFFNKKVIPLGLTMLGGVLIAIGVGLFSKFLSFAMLVNILIMVLLGAGAALIVYGIYFAVKHNVVYGIGTITIGIGLVVLTSIYINVPDFAKAFWIIVGILIAIYGGIVTILYLVDKKLDK